MPETDPTLRRIIDGRAYVIKPRWLCPVCGRETDVQHLDEHTCPRCLTKVAPDAMTFLPYYSSSAPVESVKETIGMLEAVLAQPIPPALLHPCQDCGAEAPDFLDHCWDCWHKRHEVVPGSYERVKENIRRCEDFARANQRVE